MERGTDRGYQQTRIPVYDTVSVVLCEVERWRVLLDSEHSLLYSKYVQVPNLPQSESLIPTEVFSRNKSTAQKVLVYTLFPFYLLTVLPINFLFGM